MSSPGHNKDYLSAVQQSMLHTRRDVLKPAERYLNDVPSLPPAPTLVAELLTLFREPDRDVDQIVQLISYEPSLTAQILRTCNSVHFAGEQPPEDIFEAVTRIGFYQVYCLVVSIFGARTKGMQDADKGINVDEMWRHSVAVAVAASVVAEGAGESKAVAFTAGLLHDIGKLVLAAVERERYAALIQRAKDEGVLLVTIERSVLGTDHAEIGGELMRRWKLPPDVAAAVAHHHDDGAPISYRALAASVQLGDIIGRQFFAEDPANAGFVTFSTATLDILHLKEDDLPGLVAKAWAEMEKVQGMLEM